MKILRWYSSIRTPVRYHSAPQRPYEDRDMYELHISPCIEPDGKIYFAEHRLVRNGSTIDIRYYQYNPDVSNSSLMSLGQNRVIDLNK